MSSERTILAYEIGQSGYNVFLLLIGERLPNLWRRGRTQGHWPQFQLPAHDCFPPLIAFVTFCFEKLSLQRRASTIFRA